MPDREFLAAIRWIDDAYWNTRTRIARTGSNAWIAMFTVVLTFATVAQAFYMYWGMQQTDAVIDQMRLEQRAWVSFRGAAIVRPIGGEEPQFIVEYGNYGIAPAYISKIVIQAAEIDPGVRVGGKVKEILDRCIAMSDSDVQMVLAPGKESRIPLDFELPENIENDIASGKTDFYLIGRIAYTDPFGTEGESQACYDYDHGSEGSESNLTIFMEGNYME